MKVKVEYFIEGQYDLFRCGEYESNSEKFIDLKDEIVSIKPTLTTDEKNVIFTAIHVEAIVEKNWSRKFLIIL